MKKELLKGIQKVLFTFCLLLAVCVLNSKEVKAAETEGFWQYEILDDGTVEIINYTGAEMEIVIPSKLGGRTVVGVGGYWDSAFEDNVFIENVDVPSTVKYISDSCFAGCSNLKTVSGCSGLVRIDRWAFKNCGNLEKVSIGNKLETIGYESFVNCIKLKTIAFPKSLVSIGDSAFYNCDGLYSVILPDNLLIGHSAFRECDTLYSVNFGVNTTLDESVFRSCDKLYSIKFGEGTWEIPRWAFAECKSLENIVFSKNTWNIGYEAFYKCSSLKKIDLPASIRYINDGAFCNCSSVSSINLKYGVMEIGGSAFENLYLLTNVNIPNSVSVIGNYAFAGCGNLETITVPRSVTKIGSYYSNFEDTFYKAIIRCYSGSYIHTSALANGLPVEILEDRPCTSISFSNTSQKIMAGETYRFAPTLSPSNTTDAVTWLSGDDSIAAVNSFGEVTGIKPGLCTIVATTTNGKRATFNVTVTKKPNAIYFSNPNRTAIVGKSFTYKPIVKDEDGVRNDVRIIFFSSDPSIATVSSTGVVTPKKAGTVTISAGLVGMQTTYKLTVVNSMSIANSNISKKLNVTSCVYNGKSRTPSVIASLNGTKLVKGTDYTVTYKNNIYPGTASVVVTGKGKFTGSTTLKMTIKAPSFTAKQNTSAYATNSVSLKWSKVTGVSGYEVYRSASASSGYKKVKTTTGVSYKNTGLSSGKTYYYKVKAYKTVSGTKKYIATSAAVKTGTRPATPVAKVTAGSKKATISWKAITGASGYEVYMSKTKTGTYSKIKAVSSSTKSVTKTGLTKGKRYYFKVKAYKTINGVKVFSSASTIVSVVVK